MRPTERIDIVGHLESDGGGAAAAGGGGGGAGRGGGRAGAGDRGGGCGPDDPGVPEPDRERGQVRRRGKTVTVRVTRGGAGPLAARAGGADRRDRRGRGDRPVHLPRLTERFYRVDSHRSREQGGTGLGLAIVKHIVNRHRGRFRIESEKGRGSTFSVILSDGVRRRVRYVCNDFQGYENKFKYCRDTDVRGFCRGLLIGHTRVSPRISRAFRQEERGAGSPPRAGYVVCREPGAGLARRAPPAGASGRGMRFRRVRAGFGGRGRGPPGIRAARCVRPAARRSHRRGHRP